VDFSESNVFWGDFYIFISADVGKRIFQSQRNDRFESHRFIVSAFSDIGLLFIFGEVYHHISWFCTLPYDHSLIHRRLRQDENFSSFLQLPDAVFHAFSIFQTDHRSCRPLWDIALVRRIMREGTIHDSLALGHQDKLGSKSEQASRRHFKFQGRDAIDGVHIGHLSFFVRDHIDDRP